LTAAIVIAALASAWGGAVCGESSELSAETACNEIRSRVSGVAHAERAEADALQLAGQGGDLASVESQLDQLLDRVASLRDTLRKVSHSRLTHDPDVANCLTLGYRALYEAEKLTTEVEQILLQEMATMTPQKLTRDGCRRIAA
jgi:hypothetical protein